MDFITLRFLADENIHPALILWMQENGFHVENIRGTALAGANDYKVLQYAEEKSLIILTHDSDFGQMVFTGYNLTTGIIFIRPGHIKEDFHQKTILAISQSNLNLKAPFLLVADKTQDSVRIRLRTF